MFGQDYIIQGDKPVKVHSILPHLNNEHVVNSLSTSPRAANPINSLSTSQNVSNNVSHHGSRVNIKHKRLSSNMNSKDK